MTEKFCDNCEHKQQTNFGEHWLHWRCTAPQNTVHPESINLVTGKNTLWHDSCNDARYAEEGTRVPKCGREGDWFSPNLPTSSGFSTTVGVVASVFTPPKSVRELINRSRGMEIGKDL